MLSIFRGASPPKSSTASHNPVNYENGRSQVHFHPPSTRSEHFMMTNVMPPTDAQNGATILQPPFHFHIHQAEKFRVLSGTAVFYKGLSPKPLARIQAGDNRLAHIEARRYHRFENGSAAEDLVVEIQLDPEDYEKEVCFFRNFFGYLNDCKRARMEPSLFQLMVFLKSADTPLALPLPLSPVSEAIGVWLSLLFMHVVAFVGSLLGYRETYPEYYEISKAR